MCDSDDDSGHKTFTRAATQVNSINQYLATSPLRGIIHLKPIDEHAVQDTDDNEEQFSYVG